VKCLEPTSKEFESKKAKTNAKKANHFLKKAKTKGKKTNDYFDKSKKSKQRQTGYTFICGWFLFVFFVFFGLLSLFFLPLFFPLVLSCFSFLR
jgi:Flp pilus assembly protein TadB